MSFALWLIIFIFLLGFAASVFYIVVILYHIFRPAEKKKTKGSASYRMAQLKEVGRRL